MLYVQYTRYNILVLLLFILVHLVTHQPHFTLHIKSAMFGCDLCKF